MTFSTILNQTGLLVPKNIHLTVFTMLKYFQIKNLPKYQVIQYKKFSKKILH